MELTLNHVWEDTGLKCLARVLGWDGALIVQADISGVTLKVVDTADDSVLYSKSLSAADCIYDTEQTDATGKLWPYSDGYNFAYVVPAAGFTTGGKTVDVQFIADPASGEDYMIGPYRVRVHTSAVD